MSSFGKTINLYLMDGSEAGRWQATLSNWNGVGYKIPHSEIKNCSDLPELNTPGVYFLFGKDDESGKQFIYVGEADDVQKRLLQPHTFEKDGSYWTEAVIFVTPDGTLEKGRVKYLENRFYTIATNTKRYLVKNGNTPTQSQLPKSVRNLLEEFIIDVRLVLPVLGYMAFVPMPSADTSDTAQNNDLLYFSRNKGKGGKATGIIKSDGFFGTSDDKEYSITAHRCSRSYRRSSPPVGEKGFRQRHDLREWFHCVEGFRLLLDRNEIVPGLYKVCPQEASE